MLRLPLIVALLFAASTAATAQWVIQDSRTTADLRGIHSIGKGVAWASGTSGTVIRTTDDGAHWQPCVTPPGAEALDFRGIQAFDADTAIVMSSGKGDLSRLYKTTDACKTWMLVFTNPDKDGFFDALSIRAPHHDLLDHPLGFSTAWGIVLGDPVSGRFSLFETNNGGETWFQRVATKRGPKGEGCKRDDFVARNNEAAFAASNESLVTLNGVYLLFVTGGAVTRLGYNDLSSWDGAFCHESTHFINLPLVHSSESSGAFAMAVSPEYESHSNYPDKVVIVGGDYIHPDVTGHNAATIDKVGTPLFQTVRSATTPPHGFRSAVAYDSATKTWVTVGPNGTDVSTDDGRNWHALKPSSADAPDADRDWNALSLPFVVGPKGRIGKFRVSARSLEEVPGSFACAQGDHSRRLVVSSPRAPCAF